MRTKLRFILPLAAFALALCTVITIPSLSGAARAVDFNAACSLRVEPASSSNRPLAEDIASAKVVVDLYKVADAEDVDGYDTYTFKTTDDFSALTVGGNMADEDWASLAQSAADIALDGKEPAVSGAAADSKIDGLKCGLYLVIARGSDIEEYKDTVTDENGNGHTVTIANSHRYTYRFTPVLVSLPSKETGEGGALGTGGNAPWMYDMTVTLKPEQAQRYGALEIEKILNTYDSREPAAFVFDITAVLDGKTVLSDVAAVSFTEAGRKTAILENIPVGASVTVKEVYSGTVYETVTADTQTAVIEPDETVSVSFTNDYNNTGKSGGSVINHFEYDEESGWQWTQISDGE